MISHHAIGPFRELSHLTKVVCVVDEPMLRCREETWTIPETGSIEIISLKEKKNIGSFVYRFLTEHSQSIHFIGGFRGSKTASFFWKHVVNTSISPLVITERPDHKKGLMLFLRDLYYHLTIRRLKKRIAGFLAMGNIGEKTYIRYGMPRGKIFPYMCTFGEKFPTIKKNSKVGSPLRFVYVGQDIRERKGLDLLIQAFKRIPSGYSLDFIGSTENSWIKNEVDQFPGNPSIRLLGKMPSATIPQFLADHYDILILPSRHDGWGMTVSEAVLSGLGAIVSDACGSMDIINTSGAGTVVKSGSEEELYQAICHCIQQPEMVLNWKQRAVQYRDRLRPEGVANYLEAVIEYIFDHQYQNARPRAIWLDDHHKMEKDNDYIS